MGAAAVNANRDIALHRLLRDWKTAIYGAPALDEDTKEQLANAKLAQ
jgi:hypothetical protein